MHHYRHHLVAHATILTLLALVAAPTFHHTALSALPFAQNPPAPAPLPAPGPPCALDAERLISPHIVEAGQPLTISVSIHYDCTQPPPPLDLIFAIEDTTALIDPSLPADTRAASLARLQTELVSFIDGLDPANGSRIGLYRADLGGPAATLGAGSTAFDAARTAVAGLSAKGACHRRSATLDAIGRTLDHADPDRPAVVIYLATAAAPCEDGGMVPPPVDPSIGEACTTLKEQATVALVDQGGEMRGCNTAGWYYRVSDPNNETPAALTDIANRLLAPDLPLALFYAEELDPLYFSYELGSGNPPPNSDGEWPIPLSGSQKGTHGLQFRALTQAAPVVGPVSLPPGPTLRLVGRSITQTWHLSNADVCIHRAGRRTEDCARMPIRYTPTPVPTAHATALPTASSGPALFIPRADSP